MINVEERYVCSLHEGASQDLAPKYRWMAIADAKGLTQTTVQTTRRWLDL